VPFGGDQLENARRVEALGTGVAVLPDALTSESISRAFDTASARRARAAEVSEWLRGIDGTANTVAIVEELGARTGG